MTFYLKYRPQTIEELDLENVRKALKDILSSGKIPHAFLFSGPKGVGKTSAARILAKVINCERRSQKAVDKKRSIEPCNKCDQCSSITNGTSLDIIELDAASNRGIDDIRSLREAVKLSPVNSRKKVYIIDEVHMLTTEAANAFLKTLEEPPDHVVFILATTNPEKLPATVRSRLVNVVFTKATPPEIERQLKRIAKSENIKAEEGVFEAIAKVSDGSFRDAAKLLESASLNSKKISLKDVKSILGDISSKDIDNFIKHLVNKDAENAIETLESLIKQGVSIPQYLESLLATLHSALLAKHNLEGFDDIENLKTKDLIKLISLFSEAHTKSKSAFIGQLPAEIAVIKWCRKKKEEKPQKIDPVALPAKDAIEDSTWKKIMHEVGITNTSIEALLRASKPIQYQDNKLTLGVFYSFHKEQLERQQNRLLLESAISKIVGKQIQIDFALAKRQELALTDAKDEDIIRVAEEIFNS